MSFLDVLLLSEADSFNSSRELFDFVMYDTLSYLSTTFFFSQTLYYTDYQDFFVVVLCILYELYETECRTDNTNHDTHQ